MTLRLVKPIFVPAGRELSAPAIARTAEPSLQFRSIHGYRQAFVYTGQGPAILLIHGIGDSSETWREVIPMLARNYTVIAPDLLGHGQSDKPRTDYSVAAYANGIRDLLKMLKIERVTAVGHSLGGGVAMQFAYQYAAQCERLVLISSGGVCADVNQLLRLAAAPSSELVLPLVTWVGTRTLTRWFCKLMKRLDADIGLDADDLMRVLDALPNPASQRAFLRTLRSVVDWRGQAVTMLDRCYLARRMPTLLVWGSRDAVIPASHAQIARLAMPGSKLEMFEGAGHFPFRSDPERFVSALDRFVRHTEPSRYCDDEWREMLLDGPPERKPVTRPVPTKCLRADTCGAWCADLPNQEAQCPKPTANVLVDLRVSKLATVRAHDQCSNS